MATRAEIRVEALLFGANSMFEVLRVLARETGEFHGGGISRATGYSRKQVQLELRKLETLGIVERAGQRGRAELMRICDDELADAVLALPELLLQRVESLRQRTE